MNYGIYDQNSCEYPGGSCMSVSSILLVEDHAGFAKALLNMLAQNQEL
jgi:hypothetical protein